jgi:hypothetical protein
MLQVVTAWLQHLRRAAVDLASGNRTRQEVLDELADPAAERLLAAVLRSDAVRPVLEAAGAPVWLLQHPGFLARLREVDAHDGRGHALA